MTAMIDPDVMSGAEIEEAELDAWYESICDRCGYRGADHDDGECPAPPRPDPRVVTLNTGETITLYWSGTLHQYVTIPERPACRT
jgi:hypothetical protein